MKDMMRELVQRLQKAGFMVNTMPQEKLQWYKELVVDISDIRLEIETPQTYEVTVRFEITFVGSDRMKCLETLQEIMQAIEKEKFKSCSVQMISDIRIEAPGEFLMATLYVDMKEVINFGSQ